MAVTNSPPLLSCLAWDSRPAALMRRVAQHLHPHPKKHPQQLVGAPCPGVARCFLAQQLVGEFCSRIKDFFFIENAGELRFIVLRR